MSREIYHEIVTTLQTTLCPEYYLYVEPPRCFKDKTSFGDVDLLVSSKTKDIDFFQVFQSETVKNNGSVISFDFRGYQIDLIKISQENIEFSHFFYDYGDMGMIFGMFMRNLKMKFAVTALTLKLETYKIVLSQDIADVLRFLDMDIEIWRKGFDYQNSLFQFITTSKYFRKSFFARNAEVMMQDENRKNPGHSTFEQPVIWRHENRARFDERPMFRGFIEYVNSMPEQHLDLSEQSDIISEALDFFHKRSEYEQIERHLALTRRVKQKFNGIIAMKICGLQGKALGCVISGFRFKYPLDRLDKMTDEDIQDAFSQYLLEFNERRQDADC